MPPFTDYRLPWHTALTAWLLLLSLPTAGAEVMLLYSGNLNGELEPCGCTIETDYGGLLRRATLIDGLRETLPELVAVTTGGLLTADIASDRIKAGFILSGLARIGYDAIGVQWPDLAYGIDLLEQSSLPTVASNWSGAPFLRETRIERTGIALTYFQWLDPATAPQLQMQADTLPVTSDTSALGEALAAARARGDVTLLGTTLTLEQAQAQLPLDDVSILLVHAAPEHPGHVAEVGDMLVLTPGTRGMRLGRIDFETAPGGQITAWREAVLEMTNTIDDAPRMADWYEAYNAALRAEYFANLELRKARDSGEAPYTGAEDCIVCHATAGQTWKGSNHAGTLGLLEAVGKAFDPNCIGCHVVGADRDGGYLSRDLTPQLANVQCESCHGPGRAHVQLEGRGGYPLAGHEPAEACAGCHNANHSPSFDRAAYWPRIIHGL